MPTAGLADPNGTFRSTVLSRSAAPGKRAIGVKAAAKLSDAELASLFELLEQAVMRHPEEKKNYDALRHLVEQQIPCRIERSFARVMASCGSVQRG